MENKMYQDEFEQFLQDEVKQHRMYPSDHIWKNIRTEIHGYNAWPALTFISLFIITALTVSTLISNHPHQQPVLKNSPIVTVQKPEQATAAIAVRPSVANTNYFDKIAAERITAETFADLTESSILQNQPVTVSNTFSDHLQTIAVQPYTDRPKQALSEKTAAKPLPVAASQPSTSGKISTHTITLAEQLATVSTAMAVTTPPENKEARETRHAEQNTMDKHATADDFLKDFSFVSNSAPRRNSRFGFQFYITPSTSYRRLSDEKVKEIIQPSVATTQNAPLGSYAGYSANVNSVVRHKPAMGIEAGFAILYNMSNRLKFKTGIQLNIRQYYIQTFQSLTNDLTSLALINFRGVETISFYSPYNNNTGYRQTQLDNKVYQVSIPVGIQWEMIQGKHFGINSEASIQPTMTLNNNTYLLSTDYKHYTNGNEFIRKWNINTSMGLNFTYKAGNNSWQIGPQIRYQHLPTYSNAYPIKEYLLDYGVRLAFTRQIK